MNTEESFDHLDVINSVLSLAYNLESYPNHLYKAGYRISRIEPQFNVNRTLNPDILFISNDRGLFCECKSGEFHTGNNLKTYQNITTRNLVEKGIDVTNENLEFDVGIFGKKNIEVLKDKLQEKGITFPQVVIDEFIQKKFGDDFKDAILQELFNKPLKIERKPMVILKFSKDSSVKKIAPFIFSTLMSRSVSKQTAFTSRELTEESLGDIWDNLDKDLQKSLNGKVRKFLKHCKSHELKDYLSNNEDIWKIEINEHWKSRKKFSDDCDLLIQNLRQKILFDFGFEEENE